MIQIVLLLDIALTSAKGGNANVPTGGACFHARHLIRDVLPSISTDGRMLTLTAAHSRPRAGGQLPWLEEAAELQVRTKDLSTGKEAVLSDKTAALWHPQISRDGSMIADSSSKPRSKYVAPVTGEPSRMIVDGNKQWIAIDHPSRWDDKPRCSPDGNLIYFTSDRDGYVCLWAQRFDARAKALIGAAFPVYHFHNARLSMANVDAGILEIGVARDKIVVGLGELTGNIWSMRQKSKY